MATFTERLARILLKTLEKGDLRSIEDALSRGADPNLLLEPEGISAMHLFLGPDCSNSLAVIGLLLRHGGNPNVRSYDGMTSLHVCAAWGKIDVMLVLLKNGGDPNLIDFDGNSVVGLALDNGHLEIIDVLHSHCDNIHAPKAHLHVDAGGDRLAGKSYRAGRTPSSLSAITTTGTADVEGADLNAAFVCAASIPALECASVEILPPILGRQNSSHNTLSDAYLSAISSEADSCRTYCTVDEFLFVDNRENVALLERQYLRGGDCKASGDDALSSHSCCSSVVSDAESLPASVKDLPDDVIRQKLKSLGDFPGPLTPNTRRVYLRRLHCLLKGGQQLDLTPASKTVAIYSHQLSLCLAGRVSVESYRNLEVNFFTEFIQKTPRMNYRGDVVKSCFNYFLLDPCVSQNLPQRVSSLTDSEAFRTFVSAVFYVGKGQQARAYDHFYEALRLSKASAVKVSAKVRRIQAIWESGFGVVCLHCFQGTIQAEALTREACIIDAIGKENLTNERAGTYYRHFARWLSKDKCKLGSVFLHRAFCIFVQEGERQIYPFDLGKLKPLAKIKKK